MPMDMPPQYHIEQSVQTVDRGVMSSLSNAKKAMVEYVSSFAQKPSLTESALPAIDVKSKALTREDRLAMVEGMRANRSGTLDKGVSAPNSYVGDRLRLASGYAKAHDAIRLGTASETDLKALRCRMIGVAMDKRAGAYLQGGEPAAAKARASISQDDLKKCREAAEKAMARLEKSPSVGVTPQRLAQSSERRVGVSPEANMRPVRINLDEKRVRINLSEKPIRINLQPQPRINLDLKAQERIAIDPKPLAQQRGAQIASLNLSGKGR